MQGTIRTRQKCSICKGPLIYDEKRRGCFCEKHPEQMATGGWYVQVGRDHRKRFSKDFVGAERHLNFIRSQKDHNQYDPRDWQKDQPLSLAELGKKWLRLKEQTRPPLNNTTMRELRISIVRANAFWGPETQIKSISDDDVHAFVGYPHMMMRKGMTHKLISEKTAFNLFANIKSFFEWACEIAKCPSKKWPALGYEMNETQHITIEQQANIEDWLLDNCPEPMIGLAVSILCANPNVRPGELIELKWGHIDIFQDQGILYIHKRKSRRKRGSRKRLPPKIAILSQVHVNMIKGFKWGDPDDYFFRYTVRRRAIKVGKRFDSKMLNEWFKRASAKFNLDTCLYAGTKHTTTTGARQYLNREQVMRGGTGHASKDGYDHYDHDSGLDDQIRFHKTFEKMRREKIKRVK